MKMANKIQRCHRCGRRLRNPNSANADGWISVLREGIIAETFCPACTTPVERAESVMAAATTELALSGEFFMQRTKFKAPA
ncbi:hypothetical protein [Mycobacterium avium]